MEAEGVDPAVLRAIMAVPVIRIPMRRLTASAVLGIFLACTGAGRAQEVKPPAPPPEFDPATEPAVVAVARVLPAVVNIATERTIRQTGLRTRSRIFTSSSSTPRPTAAPASIKQKIQSLGSGFLIDAEGNIVTNEHVVERAADLKIQVTFSDGASLPARYVSGDAAADLALIKVERGDAIIRGGKPFPFYQPQQSLAQFARGNRPRAGQSARLQFQCGARHPQRERPRDHRRGNQPTSTCSRPTPPSIPATAAARSSTSPGGWWASRR